MKNIEDVFQAIVALGRRDAEVRMEVLATHEHGRELDAVIPFEAIADLIAAGRVDTWEKEDGSIVVCLTPLSAERLGLKLLPDSSRWVDVKEKVRPPKRKRNARTIAETDLDDETETPLDERPDPKNMRPIDADTMYEDIAERRAGMAGVSGSRVMAKWDAMTPPSVVMMGVLPYPHPGQDRGPWAPRAVPEPEDRRKDWKLQRSPDAPACHACKGNPANIPSGSVCEPCMMLGGRERPDVAAMVEAGRAENLAEWSAWERRQEELEAENARAVAEIMAWDEEGEGSS